MQVARRICSSLFSLPKNRPLLIIDILMCVLDSITRECKVILINCIHERSFNESGIWFKEDFYHQFHLCSCLKPKIWP